MGSLRIVIRTAGTHNENKSGADKVVKEDKGESDSESRLSSLHVLHVPSLLDLLTVMTA